MLVVALGGTGFIGSHVVEALIAAGHHVRVLSSRGPGNLRLMPRLSYIKADLRDAAALRHALAGSDAVMHMVSTKLPATGDLDPKGDIGDNLLGTVGVLEAMRDLGIPRLVYLSSGGTVYGPPDQVPIREDHPLRPMNSYGIVKAAAESYIRLFSKASGLASVILRPSNPYGPRQARAGQQGLVNTLMSRARSGEPIHIWGDGSVIRDYLHVEDMARLCVLALDSTTEGTFNAGSGQGTSVREMIDLVSFVSRRPLNIAYGAARSVDAPVSVLDVAAAGLAFGWRPAIDLPDGLEMTWNWHRAQAQAA
jgi:UDP-glucose 4-epimerase